MVNKDEYYEWKKFITCHNDVFMFSSTRVLPIPTRLIINHSVKCRVGCSCETYQLQLLSGICHCSLDSCRMV